MNATSQDLTAEDEQARQQAISLAGQRALPITARSMTAQEIAAIDRLYYPAILGAYAIGAIGLLAALWFGGDGEGHGLFAIAASAALILSLPLWLLARSKAGRRQDYRDPGIAVDAGADGIAIRHPGSTIHIAYADAAIAGFIVQAAAAAKGARTRRVLFLGITLDTPLGPLAIENRSYKLGTRTAAAIVSGRDALGLPVLAIVR
jgi:hypothetical protein